MYELAFALAQRGGEIEFDLRLPGLIALIAGIVILVFPRALNYIVAAYLIAVGLIQLFDIRL